MPQIPTLASPSFAGQYERLAGLLRQEMDDSAISDIFDVLGRLPIIDVKLSLKSGDGTATHVKKCKKSKVSLNIRFCGRL
jgi:hypothetical protein